MKGAVMRLQIEVVDHEAEKRFFSRGLDALLHSDLPLRIVDCGLGKPSVFRPNLYRPSVGIEGERDDCCAQP